MKILILGGTVFVGRSIVDAALDRGHDVTVFHRGHNATHRPGDVREIFGDRDGNVSPLRRWSGDAVVDTSGYVPAVVRDTFDALGDVGHYTFVSSASVYADLSAAGVTEEAPVHDAPASGHGDPTGEAYGPLKVGCEREVGARFPDRSLIVRAGLLVGPHDPTDRFTYWVRRVADGGTVLAPDIADSPVQVLDVRDLARWVVRGLETVTAGVMNAAGERDITFADVIAACATVAGSHPEMRWVGEQWLLDRDVEPWSELPLWLPAAWGLSGMMAVDATRAVAAGLRRRPLPETIADTLAWDRGRRSGPLFDYGTRSQARTLSRQRESELLAEAAQIT